MAGGSFGGTIKLTGESEYVKALKTITSNMTVMASEMKLVSTRYADNTKSIESLTSQNKVLNQQIEEGNKKVDTYRKALNDFNSQQEKNKATIDTLKASIESENQTLEKMKNSTTATSKEIEDQENKIASLTTELAKTETEYQKNNVTINKYQTELNNAETQVIKLSNQLNANETSIKNNKSSYQSLSETINSQKSELNELKERYASVVLEQGKSSSEAKELQKEIKNLSSDMKDNEKVLADSTAGVDKFTESEKDAGKESITLGTLIKANLISDAIVGGIKLLGSALKEVGSAMINVGKQAVSSFADYEQLVGGVETLFKESADVVQDYANNAYKTAGLSANQYMETVTSFSASLLQSLNGDTAKAAEVADMAITDMADNANKMGTSMSSIQSAYQGFAKQNYTMLDNLKLGYGGTKTEMERLLSDATKLSGIKYDISNLNDVYEAIHVVQTELGITGTTAKEASETITGSVSAMKSSWTNLLTGLANGNADLTELINNVVDSALTVADNILPVVDQVASSILDVLPKLLENIIAQLPKFLETGSNILTSIITGLQSNMSSIMTAVMQIINMLIKTIIQNLPQIIEMGIQMLTSLIEGIAESLPELIPTIIDAVLLIVETLLDNIDMIIDAGISILLGLIDGIMEALPKLIDKIPEIIDKLINAITDNLPKIIEMGIELTLKLAVGLIKAIPQLVAKIPEIITSLVKGLLNGVSKIADVGKNLVQGLWNGINNAKDWVLDKIKGFGKAILNGIKSFFGIKSPSTLFKDEIGKNLALGLGEGFTDEMEKVESEIADAIPTNFDLGVNASVNAPEEMQSSGYNYDLLVTALKEALDGMSFKAFDETFGALVIDNVEKVVYS